MPNKVELDSDDLGLLAELLEFTEITTRHYIPKDRSAWSALLESGMVTIDADSSGVVPTSLARERVRRRKSQASVAEPSSTSTSV